METRVGTGRTAAVTKDSAKADTPEAFKLQSLKNQLGAHSPGAMATGAPLGGFRGTCDRVLVTRPQGQCGCLMGTDSVGRWGRRAGTWLNPDFWMVP